jgi:Tol biopolymer transport system component
MFTRCVAIVAAMVVLTLAAGCGKAGPTAPSVPLTDTPVPPVTMAALLTETSPPSSGDGLIVFHSERDGNMEIYVMNTDGSDQRRLTNNDADDVCPAWSPDGTQIAFVSNRGGNDEIYVMNADGSGQRRLTNNDADDGFPAWSPDGMRIAFDSGRGGDWEIY